MAKTFLNRLAQNWKAGLTVALVNIPLSISLAVAANATPTMGIITAVWAGLMTALLGGSNFNIVGPTGALSGILATFAIINGVELLPALALFTGILIFIVFLFRWERYIVFTPASVIHGFTLGVALIISLNQLNFATGLTGLKSHPEFISNILESIKHISSIDYPTFGLFLVSLIFLFIFSKYSPKFPGAIILAPIGILLGYLSSTGKLPIDLQTLFTKFGEIDPVIFQKPTFSLSSMLNKGFFVTGLTVAFVAVLETLISAKIADGITKTTHDKRKEVFGLSIANVMCGLTGGIPATAALARTVLNVKSGANHKTSAGVSAVVVAIISLVLLPWFKFLPLAIVGAILVHVAARMIQKEHFIHLYEHDKSAFFISMLVAVITIVEDPMIGILVGAVIALLMFVNKLSKGQAEISISKNNKFIARFMGKDLTSTMLSEQEHGDVIVYRFSGQLTYINTLAHLETVKTLKTPHTVILALRNLFYIDLDGLDGLEEIVEALEQSGKKVIITGVSTAIEPVLRKAKFYVKKQHEKNVYENTTDALKHLGLIA